MSSPRNTRLGPLPKPIPAPVLAASRTRSPGKTSRDFFPPCFSSYCFLERFWEALFPWKPLGKEKALEMLVFVGWAFFPSTSSLPKGAEINSAALLGIGINPRTTKRVRC